MKQLYTEHVLPDDLLELWNNGLGNLSHVIGADRDKDEEKPRMVAKFVRWLTEHLMKVDAKPVLSRFFTFRQCIEAMLAMSLLGFSQHAFQLRKVKPRAENKKRLDLVQKFFRHTEAVQLLKRSCLTFQLTGGLEAILSELPTEGRIPPVVRLCKGEATELVNVRIRMLFKSIAASDDPDLDVGEATGVLLAVSMELVVRMRRFSEYPIAVIRMSKTWFRDEGCTAVDNVHAFLQVDVRQLDIGLSLQLRELAFAQGDGTEIAAASWLLSPPVQEMIDTIAKTVLANSLDAERRHAQAKELATKKRLRRVGQASRDLIQIRYLRWRDEVVDALRLHETHLQRVLRTNIQALAWAQPEKDQTWPTGNKWSTEHQPSEAVPQAKKEERAVAADTQHRLIGPIRNGRAATEERRLGRSC